MRLRTRGQYRRMNSGKRSIGYWVIVEIRQGKGAYPKLGLTVTRRYGKAHDRNRFKRIVREAFRLSSHLIPRGLEILVKPRSSARNAKMQDIQQELLQFVRSAAYPISEEEQG